MRQLTDDQRQSVRDLRDMLSTYSYTFSMSNPWAHPSDGTGGCIGAHAAILWQEVRREHEFGADMISWDDAKLQAKIGLDQASFEAMIFPVAGHPIYAATWHHQKGCAIVMLTNYMATGEVQWKL